MPDPRAGSGIVSGVFGAQRDGPFSQRQIGQVVAVIRIAGTAQMGQGGAVVCAAPCSGNGVAELVAIDRAASRQGQADGVVRCLDDGRCVWSPLERTAHPMQNDPQIVGGGITEVVWPELVADVLA